jgi:hypothetical protein
VANEKKDVKPISELTLEEAGERLAEMVKKRIAQVELEAETEELARRIQELYTPVEEMTLEQLKEEVMKLDAYKCDVIKPFYEREKAVLDSLYLLSGCRPGFEWEGDTPIDEDAGIHWQDDSGKVWATERRTGTFIEYKPFGVTRTRYLERGETKGLSMTKARKLGYVVEGK